MKTLVVAEKPSVGMELAKLLDCKNKANGYIEGENYIITWAVGHLIGLKYPEEHDQKYKVWRLEDLPFQFAIADSLKVLPNTKKQFEVIKKLIHRADVSDIINAGDAGREGYLIQTWIYRMAGNTKPVKVLWASSFTEEAVRQSLRNLKDDSLFYGLLQEAEARAEADHIIGINYSRALSLLNKRGLSYGRCQTPLLKLIVDRDREIAAFESKPYYNVQITAQNSENAVQAILVTAERKRADIEDLQVAQKVMKLCEEENGIILSITETEKEEAPPLLYNLAALQKDMGRRYGYTPDKTLEIAQKLYEERKILSYPRTESQYLSMDLFHEITQHLNCCNFGEYSRWLENLDMDELSADKRYFNDLKVTDHYALIPTINHHMEDIYRQLSIEEKNVFDAVVKRLIAIFYPNYKYREQEILINVHNFLFLSKTKAVLLPGFKLMDTEDKEQMEDFALKPFKNGEKLTVAEIKLQEKKTLPPKHYTVDSLIAAMEKYGIGTAATRAEIIKKLQNPSRQFVRLEKKNYLSTELGQKFIDLVPECLKEAALTQKFEEKLHLVYEGKMRKQEFLDDLVDEFRENMPALHKNVLSAGCGDRQEIGRCPLCGCEVREGEKNYYCTGYKSGCSFSLSKKILGISINAESCKKLLEKGESEVFNGFSGKNGKFDASLVLTNEGIKFRKQK